MAETIREAYIRRNPKSAALYPKFRDVFPTGVSHDMRVTDPFPLVMASGQGARKRDVDGNEYIDYGLGSASLLLGHAHVQPISPQHLDSQEHKPIFTSYL